MLHRLGEQTRRGASGGRDPRQSWAAAVKLAAAVGFAYFLAARLGLPCSARPRA